eukprot:1138866-Pelagomonas_calceolata.AAC.1
MAARAELAAVAAATLQGHSHIAMFGAIGKRKDNASQVQLHALRKGSLTRKLARALPRRLTGLCMSGRAQLDQRSDGAVIIDRIG